MYGMILKNSVLKNDSIYYFAFSCKNIKIKVEPFNDEVHLEKLYE